MITKMLMIVPSMPLFVIPLLSGYCDEATR